MSETTRTREDLAGRMVTVKPHVTHAQQPHFGGMPLRIEGWWDEVAGKSWMFCDGNPACLVYALRIGLAKHHVPMDNEVLYGHGPGGLGHLVHISEVDIPEQPEEEG